VEALVEVGAAGRFADRVETEASETALQIVQRAGMPLGFAKPIRQPASPLKLDERGLHGSVFHHNGIGEAGLLQILASVGDGFLIKRPHQHAEESLFGAGRDHGREAFLLQDAGD
jgi:hypothetical protein